MPAFARLVWGTPLAIEVSNLDCVASAALVMRDARLGGGPLSASDASYTPRLALSLRTDVVLAGRGFWWLQEDAQAQRRYASQRQRLIHGDGSPHTGHHTYVSAYIGHAPTLGIPPPNHLTSIQKLKDGAWWTKLQRAGRAARR